MIVLLTQILGRAFELGRIVVKIAYASIASLAQQASHNAGSVVVVYIEEFSSFTWLVGLADEASSTLRGENAVIVGIRKRFNAALFQVVESINVLELRAAHGFAQAHIGSISTIPISGMPVVPCATFWTFLAAPSLRTASIARRKFATALALFHSEIIAWN